MGLNGAEPDTGAVLKEVMRSKKYSRLYPPVIERVCREEYIKFDRDLERAKAVKKKLHSLYGAFAKDGSIIKISALLDKMENGVDIKKTSAEILELHASTAERVNNLAEFYEFIFKYINGGGILDLGCGLNPFSIPFMPEKPSSYRAFDVDTETRELIDRYFILLGLPPGCGCADLIIETPVQNADAAFLFKLAPVLESQRRGRAFELMNELRTELIIATYPLKSLGGKNKGMERFYPEKFEGSLGSGLIIEDKKIIGNELVYIVKK